MIFPGILLLILKTMYVSNAPNIGLCWILSSAIFSLQTICPLQFNILATWWKFSLEKGFLLTLLCREITVMGATCVCPAVSRGWIAACRKLCLRCRNHNEFNFETPKRSGIWSATWRFIRHEVIRKHKNRYILFGTLHQVSSQQRHWAILPPIRLHLTSKRSYLEIAITNGFTNLGDWKEFVWAAKCETLEIRREEVRPSRGRKILKMRIIIVSNKHTSWNG